MKKLLFACIMFLLNITPVIAAEANALVLELNDGTKEMYLLIDKPVISFKEGYLCVKSSQIDMKNYLLSDINSYYFVENDPNIVPSVPNNEVNFSFRYLNKDEIVLIGTNKAEIYSVEGKKLQDFDEYNKEIRINVSNLPSGVYVIKTNNKSIKIRK